ncbi:MAG: S8 family serine peptidase [Chloroherpetonaceae bacterium]|nr:S8 family serine peptidase [Chloroherpetonaceae bacterium]
MKRLLLRLFVSFFSLSLSTPALCQIELMELLEEKPDKNAMQEWSFISSSTCGINSFKSKYPNANGRGVLIFILDTGVDMGIQGLRQLPNGKPKVVAAYDFSSSGDIALMSYTVPVSGDIIHEGKPFKSLQKLLRLSQNEKVYLGLYDEKRRQNADVSDLDLDGKSESVFGIAVVETKEGPRFSIDTNGDHSFEDEVILANYSQGLKSVSIKPIPKDQTPLMQLAIEVNIKNLVASIHADDGAHGSHCAGIAAGFNIFGSDSTNGFDGIAPESELISLKISEGNIGELSTTGSILSAFQFAASISDTSEKPVVVNMSFGVPSVFEGNAVMEEILDTMILNHPNLYVCLSNSNEGPGLSTTGLPSGSCEAISVGAFLPSEVSRDVLANEIPEGKIWGFSSRGGEYAKPDVLAPGTAFSTVPPHTISPLMSGTSMASPYVAGSIALLLSQLRAEGFNTRDFPQRVIKKALIESATPLKRYSFLDAGAGLMNLPKAYELLKTMAKFKTQRDIISYDIQFIQASTTPEQKVRAGYYRQGFFPEEELVSVMPKFPLTEESLKRNTFSRFIELQSSSDWVYPVQKRLLVTGVTGADIALKFRKEKLSKPGIYTAIIKAFAVDSKKGRKNLYSEFELRITVVIPYPMGQNGKIELKQLQVNEGETKRYFVSIPPYTPSFQVSVKGKKEKKASCMAVLCAPEGKVLKSMYLSSGENSVEELISANDHTGGVYEIVLTGSETAKRETSEIELTIQTEPISIEFTAFGERRGKISLYNRGIDREPITLSVKEIGASRTWIDTVFATEEKSRRRIPITLKPSTKSISVSLELSLKDYNKNTDIAIAFTDSNGRRIEYQTVGNLYTTIKTYNPYSEGGTIWLEIYYGFAIKSESEVAILKLTETQFSLPKEVEMNRLFLNLLPNSLQEEEIKSDMNSNFSEIYKKLIQVRVVGKKGGAIRIQKNFLLP